MNTKLSIILLMMCVAIIIFLIYPNYQIEQHVMSIESEYDIDHEINQFNVFAHDNIDHIHCKELNEIYYDASHSHLIPPHIDCTFYFNTKYTPPISYYKLYKDEFNKMCNQLYENVELFGIEHLDKNYNNHKRMIDDYYECRTILND